jgi:hypothetical protein
VTMEFSSSLSCVYRCCAHRQRYRAHHPSYHRDLGLVFADVEAMFETNGSEVEVAGHPAE